MGKLKGKTDMETVTVEFTVNREDLLEAAGMVSKFTTIEAMCEVLQHALYEIADGPKLKGSFVITEVRE